MSSLRRWVVGGALIRSGDGLLLVANRRRDRSVEWTPPGGVIDPGETLLQGLAREVQEETGLVVNTWDRRCYCVTVDAPDMGWQLKVEAWEASAVTGNILIADPDGIVEEARHATHAVALGLLQASPPWVHTPVAAWLADTVEEHYRFVLRGERREGARIERVQ